MNSRWTTRLVLLALMSLVLVPAASAQFGIAAGLNFDSIDDISFGDASATFDQASGYHAGIFYDLGAGGVVLRLGLFYRDLGSIDVSVEAAQDPQTDVVDLSMIEVPVDVQVSVLPVPKISPYLLGGGVLGLPRSDDEEFDQSLQEVTFSAVAGLGARLELGTIALIPEFRYVIGLSDLIGSDFQVGDRTVLVDETQKVNSVQLRVGLRF